MHVTLNDILIILGWVVPVVVAWLIHSPLGSKLPKNVVVFLTALDQATVQAVGQAVIDTTTGTPDTRRAAAIDIVQRAAIKAGFELTTPQAGAAVDWIVAQWAILSKKK